VAFRCHGTGPGVPTGVLQSQVAIGDLAAICARDLVTRVPANAATGRDAGDIRNRDRRFVSQRCDTYRYARDL
jgi:hypothetical protein